jgi:hypothetical protein
MADKRTRGKKSRGFTAGDDDLALTPEWVAAQGAPRAAISAMAQERGTPEYRVGRVTVRMLFYTGDRPHYGLFIGRECVSARPTRGDFRLALRLVARNPDPDQATAVMAQALRAGCEVSAPLSAG